MEDDNLADFMYEISEDEELIVQNLRLENVYHIMNKLTPVSFTRNRLFQVHPVQFKYRYIQSYHYELERRRH